MQNKRPALVINQVKNIRTKCTGIEIDIFELLYINGWRRFELSQALLNYDPNDTEKIKIRFKKRKLEKVVWLTKNENKLLNALKMSFRDIKPTMTAYNKHINRVFEDISKKVGFHVTPHMVRSTVATTNGRLQHSDRFTQKLLGHKNIKTTYGYMMPNEDDLLDMKSQRGELKTLEGFTINEWKREYFKQQQRIRRLEQENHKLKMEIERIKNEQKRIKDKTNIRWN